MFQAHVGYSEWKLFESDEPVVDEVMLRSLYNASGHATVASAKYETSQQAHKINGLGISETQDC